MKIHWRWANDGLFTMCNEFDKLIHFRCALAGTLILLVLGISPLWAFIISLVIGILWEVKDAISYYEEHGYLGGDGFSFWDLLADITGILVALLIWKMGPYG